MNTRLRIACFVTLTAAVLPPAQADIVPFTYTQTDATTGSGSVAAFTMVHPTFGTLNFSLTAMPAALVQDPNTGLTLPGSIGSIDTLANVANGDAPGAEVVGLRWTGSVTATAPGYTVNIPLRFVPNIQASGMAGPGTAIGPTLAAGAGTSDYTWSISYGDAATLDAVWSAAPTMGVYLGNNPNFQRYTQVANNFAAGVVETYINTDTTTTAIKDAGDGASPGANAPDAWNQDLQFTFGWRSGGTFSSGAIQVDQMTFSGYLWVDENTVTAIPEPAAATLLALGFVPLLRRRRQV